MHNYTLVHTCAQGVTTDQIIELMELGLSGRHIADLVSSGAMLPRVRNALERVRVKQRLQSKECCCCA